MSKIFRSLKGLLRFKRDLKGSRNLVIYSEGEQYSSFLMPVLRELSLFNDINIFYLSSELEDSLLERTINGVKSYFIGKGSCLIYALNFLKADALVMTMPDLNTFHIKRSPNCNQYIYFHHSMVSTHMVYREGAFDQFDTMLCVGPYHKKEVRKWEQHRNLPKKLLLEHGYGPLDTIRKINTQIGMFPRNKNGSLNILFAPSWGAHGLMENYAPEVIEPLLKAGHSVIVRPHPRSEKLSKKSLDSLEANFKSWKKFRVAKGISQFDSLCESHLLISDWSGVAMEFAFGLERPVLFIDVPRKINNFGYQELAITPIEISYREEVGIVLSIEEIDKLADKIEELYETAKIFQIKIKKSRQQNIYNLDKSGKIGAMHIYNLVKSAKHI